MTNYRAHTVVEFLYPSCGNETTLTTILNVPTEIRPHAGDVEFWLIPLSNVKATIAATLLDLEFYVSASIQRNKIESTLILKLAELKQL